MSAEVHPESTANCSSWGLKYHRQQSRNTCCSQKNRRHRTGEHLSPTTRIAWRRSTSSLSQLPDFECSMYSSYSAMIAGKSFTSTPPNTRQPNGLHNSCLRLFPLILPPRYLLHDRDAIYGEKVKRRMSALGIEEVITAPRSPWQNAYVERVIRSIRRECLDHVIVLNERHLKRILRDYFIYYHISRTHLSLDKNPPEPRAVEPAASGNIVALPRVGGLHHRYTRIAA